MSRQENESEKTSLLKKIARPTLGFKIATLDRFSNPIFYSFIMSWCLFNWDRIAVLLFSKQNIIDRVMTVKNMPSNSTMFFDIPYANTIIFPLISTMFLVALSPHINNLLYQIHKSQIKKKIINQELLNRDQYRAEILAINARVRRDEAEEVKTLQSKEQKAAIKSRTVESESKISNLKEQHSLLTESISNLQNARDTLTNENNKLISYNSDLTLNHTKALETAAIKSNELEALYKKIGDATTLNDRLEDMKSEMRFKDDLIEKYKKQHRDLKPLLHELQEHFESLYRDENGSVIHNDFSERIQKHVNDYGLHISTS